MIKNDIDNFTQLKKLSIANLKIIDEILFSNLTDLEDICLSSAGFNDIHVKAFDNLINLNHLDLSGNNWSKLDILLFENLRNLQVLDLSFNHNLTRIDSGLFLSLNRLVSLSISRCSLVEIAQNV